MQSNIKKIEYNYSILFLFFVFLGKIVFLSDFWEILGWMRKIYGFFGGGDRFVRAELFGAF